MKWYLGALKKYAVFTGRSSRKEYWMFELWNAFITLALFILVTLAAKGGRQLSIGWLPALYVLAMMVPSLAETVRRLHDTNHGGGWFFVSFVPLAGPIILLVLMLKPGDEGKNRFGANPGAPPIPTAEDLQMGYLAPPLPPDRY